MLRPRICNSAGRMPGRAVIAGAPPNTLMISADLAKGTLNAELLAAAGAAGRFAGYDTLQTAGSALKKACQHGLLAVAHTKPNRVIVYRRTDAGAAPTRQRRRPGATGMAAIAALPLNTVVTSADLTVGSLSAEVAAAAAGGWGGYASDDAAATALRAARQRFLVVVDGKLPDGTVVYKRVDEATARATLGPMKIEEVIAALPPNTEVKSADLTKGTLNAEVLAAAGATGRFDGITRHSANAKLKAAHEAKLLSIQHRGNPLIYRRTAA